MTKLIVILTLVIASITAMYEPIVPSGSGYPAPSEVSSGYPAPGTGEFVEPPTALPVEFPTATPVMLPTVSPTPTELPCISIEELGKRPRSNPPPADTVICH